MSILRKIPKIEQVLDNMSLESLKRLESLMNSGNGATETYTLFGGENKLNYVNKDLGVWYCNIELERNKSVETGFLIWESETKALFVSYDITQCLKEYEIDLTNYTFVLINEKLSIEEFRRVLEDNINKEVVHIDTTGNVEIGKNLVVDGKIIVNDASKIVDTSGNKLISDGGGDIWLDIDPYSNFGDMIISQEGYDLVYNAFYSGAKNPSNKYAGIIFGKNKYIYNGDVVIVNNKTGFNFASTLEKDGIKEFFIISIYSDKSVGLRQEKASTGSGFNLYDCIFNLDDENLNFETMTLTEVGLNKLNNMFVNGKLLGLNDGDPVLDASNSYFSYYRFLTRNSTHYKFNMMVFQDGNMDYIQINIERQTGAVEMIQKTLTTTGA